MKTKIVELVDQVKKKRKYDMYGHFEIFFYTVMKQLYESRH